MRPTLHDYNLQKLSELDCTAISDVLNFTKLTNRAPRLGDFVACDEEGNVLEEPQEHEYIFGVGERPRKLIVDPKYQIDRDKYQAAQDRVIFAGDWEVVSNEYWVVIRNKELKIDLEFNDIQCDVTDWDDQWNTRDVFEINRIEELPREIEFKEGVV